MRSSKPNRLPFNGEKKNPPPPPRRWWYTMLFFVLFSVLFLLSFKHRRQIQPVLMWTQRDWTSFNDGCSQIQMSMFSLLRSNEAHMSK